LAASRGMQCARSSEDRATVPSLSGDVNQIKFTAVECSTPAPELCPLCVGAGAPCCILAARRGARGLGACMRRRGWPWKRLRTDTGRAPRQRAGALAGSSGRPAAVSPTLQARRGQAAGLALSGGGSRVLAYLGANCPWRWLQCLCTCS